MAALLEQVGTIGGADQGDEDSPCKNLKPANPAVPKGGLGPDRFTNQSD